MESKTIGKYQFSIKANANKNNPSFNDLTITLSESLKQLVKDARSSIEGEQEVNINIGRDEEDLNQYANLKRPLIKTPIKNSLYGGDFLFLSGFMENGKVTIGFYSLEKRDEFLNSFKEMMRNFIRVMSKEELSETITFNLRRVEE